MISLIAIVVLAIVVASALASSKHRSSHADYMPGWGRGHASFYGASYNGKIMANGSPFNCQNMTLACWGLPFGTVVAFSYNGVFAKGTVTDRGPAISTRRTFDLSEALFVALTQGDTSKGVITVSFTVESIPK